MSEQTSSLPRVFKTGTVRIVEDESMQGLSIVTWNMMQST